MTYLEPAPRFLPVVVALLSLLPLTGCGSLSHQSADASDRDLVEPLEQPPPMTPDQREREYRAAYDNGLRFAAKGQYALALQAFEQALAADPSSVDARFNLAASYEAVGDPMRAINIYRSILDANPNDADCYANLGTSFIKMYCRDKSPMWRKMARDAWSRSLEIKPDQPDLKEYLAKSESLE